jgi:8-oxo-dGTP pyrophosphatase MutT (NUDIX family)
VGSNPTVSTKPFNNMTKNFTTNLSVAINSAYRQFPESVGSPRLEGFDLQVLPPWCDYHEDEVLRVNIRSAAVCFISSRGVLLVHMTDKEGYPNRWDLPAGGRCEVDKTVEDIAVREFGEETGMSLDTKALELFGYAFRKERGINVGGLQDILIPKNAHIDKKGRTYFPPFEGAILDEVTELAIEPLDIFLSSKSILNSPNTWAYRRMHSSLIQRFQRITEAKLHQ